VLAEIKNRFFTMIPQDEVERQDLIDRFLKNRLSKSESREFEAELNDNTNFKKEVEQMKTIQQSLNNFFVEQTMRQTIEKLNDTYENKFEINRKPFYWIGSSIAASILFICYLAFSPIVLTDSENDITIMRGIKSNNVTDSLQQITFQNFFDGQSKMYEGQYAVAADKFNKVLENKRIRPYFIESTKWHLLAAYIKSNQKEKCLKLYEELSNCQNCEYKVSLLNRWRFWWQIQLLSFE
jgi:hypothetical protein